MACCVQFITFSFLVKPKCILIFMHSREVDLVMTKMNLCIPWQRFKAGIVSFFSVCFLYFFFIYFFHNIRQSSPQIS